MGCATSAPKTQESQSQSHSAADKGGLAPQQESGNELFKELEAEGLRKFTYNELEAATKNFSDKNLIGVGGFGDVFRGKMALSGSGPGPEANGSAPGGQTPIAIKRLKGGNDDDFEQFMKEVLLLGKLRHPNLVQLYGFGAERAACIVLELMEGGSLYFAMDDSRSGNLHFSWANRVKVLRETASGLEFLHSKSFIHRDIKAHNILLGKDYSSKLTDFGMVRVGPDRQLMSLVTTRIMGTEAYIDPRYLETGHLGYSSDVFSFGVVLMELVTGKDASEEGSAFVVETRRRFQEAAETSSWEQVADPALKGHFEREQVSKVATLAVACTDETVKSRPSMKEVKETLDAL